MPRLPLARLALLPCAMFILATTEANELSVSTDGVVVEVDRDRGTIVIDHGAIAGLLPSARTEFPTEDVGLLADVEPGDRIRFAVAPGGAGHGIPTITELHVRPTLRLAIVRLAPLAGPAVAVLLVAALAGQWAWMRRELRRARERDRAFLEENGQFRRSLVAGLDDVARGLGAVADRLRSDMARVRSASAPALAPPEPPTADGVAALPLVVVKRGEVETYRLLKERLGSERARIIWDRRRADRRTGLASNTPERRRRERRRSPPVTWGSLGYLVTERTERHLTVVA